MNKKDYLDASSRIFRKRRDKKQLWSPLRQFVKYYHENFQPQPEDVYERSLKKPTFRMLSIHSHNGCNLACKGCNHNSGVLSPGSSLSIDSLLKSNDHITSLQESSNQPENNIEQSMLI